MEDGFRLMFGVAIREKDSAGVVTFGVHETPYQTEWPPAEAKEVAVNLLSAAIAAEFEAAVYGYFSEVAGMEPEHAKEMLGSIHYYMRADAQEREDMKALFAGYKAEYEAEEEDDMPTGLANDLRESLRRMSGKTVAVDDE